MVLQRLQIWIMAVRLGAPRASQVFVRDEKRQEMIAWKIPMKLKNSLK